MTVGSSTSLCLRHSSLGKPIGNRPGILVRTVVTYSLLMTCICCCSFSAALARSPSDDARPYTLSTNVNLVVLPVTVTDDHRQFVSGLDVTQFRVYEQGRLQSLSFFQPEDIPVTVGLVVDHSGSMEERKADVIEGAKAFVRASNPQDEEFVVNFSQQVLLGLPSNVRFTSNVDELTTALSKVPASAMTALYDAIVVGLDHLRYAEKEKKVLILITDGEDNSSHYFFDQVLSIARASNVLIYSVGLFDTRQIENARDSSMAKEFKHLLDQYKSLLTQLARDTGGTAYFPGSSAEVIDVCNHIATDIRHQYTLAYTPKNANRGGYRKIRVQVTGSGQEKLVVRSRSGYVLPTKPQFIGR
jgi:Ca-activated chloride channel homolog